MPQLALVERKPTPRLSMQVMVRSVPFLRYLLLVGLLLAAFGLGMLVGARMEGREVTADWCLEQGPQTMHTPACRKVLGFNTPPR
jgi:hypothetical protein